MPTCSRDPRSTPLRSLALQPVLVARTTIVIGLTAVLVAGTAPIGVGAETERETTCTLHSLPEANPGLTFQPGSGTFHLYQQAPGTIECDGPVMGRRPTGPGLFATNNGRYGVADGATCSRGDGTFTHVFLIPTEDGELRIEDVGTFEYGMLQGGGVIGGTFTGRVAKGQLRAMPVKGNCVTEPVTRLDVRSTMTFNH